MKPKANTRLKRERELRGWSQAKVAMELGIDPTTVGRWERGLSLPYPHFREKLCTLFGKSVRELGLLGEKTDERYEQAEILHTLYPPLAFYDHAIPLQPGGSTAFVGRETLMARLKQQLRESERSPLIGLNGLPGVGKTTIAVQLIHDKEVRAWFSDGILWAGLGPRPQIAGHLSRWATLLGVDATIVKQNDSNNVLTKRIRAAIGMRRMLLVIDDAWSLEDVLALSVGGPNCACLLTTRLPPLALASHEAITVPELDEDESLALLVRLASEEVTNEVPMLQKLVHSVGGLPLALTLMGSYLRVQTYNKQPRRLHMALQRLSDEKERLHLSKPLGVLDHHTALSYDTPLSLQSVIAISDQRLSEQARQALLALSVMPAKPRSFSEEAALAVSALPADALDELCDAGLLECTNSNRYTLHQTIADYARLHLHDIVPYRRLVTYFVQYVTEHQKDYRALGQESGNILTALDIAYEQEMKTEFVRGVNALSAFLCIRGLYGLAEPHLQRAHQLALSLSDTDGVLMSSQYLGEIAEKRGDYIQAKTYFQEGLLLARREQQYEHIVLLLAKLGNVAYHLGNEAQIEASIQECLALQRQHEDVVQVSLFLVTLGAGAVRRGNIAQADTYLQKGLALARQTKNEEQICLLLLHIGAVAEHSGDFVQAESVLEEGLALARHMKHYEYMVALLTVLGVTVEQRGMYEQTDAYFEEGLKLARQIANPMRTGILLAHLGRRAGEQSEYEKAKAYYQEALALGQRIAHVSLKLVVLNNWGGTYLQMHNLEAAALAFHEALALTPEGQHEFSARTYYGLARIAEGQHNFDEAKRFGEASLHAFEALGHHQAHEVRAWLNTLPRE